MSESASGEASSDSSCTDKDLSCPECGKLYTSKSGLKYHVRNHCPDHLVECPTCGKGFLSEYGMKQHHTKSHGDSLSVSEYVCDQCGSNVERVDQNVKGEYLYCSVACKAEWQSENLNKSNNPNYSPEKHETRECKNCGSDFDFYTGGSFERRRNAGTYCGSKCLDEWRSEHLRGEDHPLWIDSSIECDNCGVEFQKKPSKQSANDLHFCSRSCHGEWISDNMTGENHPRWKGGHVEYGEDWYEARRKALDRDKHTCQDCQTHRSNLDVRVHVHHITPVRDFDNPNDAHYLLNLITLCQSCHSKWEGLYLRPDTR